MKLKWPLQAALIVVCMSSGAQVAPPNYGRYANNLQKRYEDLRCAMVTISWVEQTQAQIPNNPIPQTVTITHFGSGFYVSADGDIVTAAHVLGNKSWSDPGTGMVVSVATPDLWTIQDSKNESRSIPSTKLEHSPDAWGADLARIKTGYKPPCWLRIREGASLKPGEHVITMGFPQLAFRSLSLYTGIISARLKSDVLVGATIQGAPVKAQNDFLRVQMPISPGLSGAAVIDDRNQAVAVVSSAGVSNVILDYLIQVANNQEMVAPPPGQSHNVDWPEAVGNLARTIREYASPGYGDSVPLSYLKTKPKAASTDHASAAPVHRRPQDRPN